MHTLCEFVHIFMKIPWCHVSTVNFKISTYPIIKVSYSNETTVLFDIEATMRNQM